MTRDEIIKGLENEIRRIHREPKGKMLGIFMTVDEAEDIVAMLKEHEPVEPTFRQDKDGDFVWACGSCGAYMYHIYDEIDKAKEYAKYCRQCGKKVKWK